jgi:DNA invertase Pin-like site-specific DNA recombinase
MIFTVLGAVAELERNNMRERITVGLSRARKEGKTLGRPKVIADRQTVRELYKAGTASGRSPQRWDWRKPQFTPS